jgi:hypothetical protein
MFSYGPVDDVLDGREAMNSWVMFCTVLLFICFASSQALFNATVWYFSSNYYICAVKVKFVSTRKQVPA